ARSLGRSVGVAAGSLRHGSARQPARHVGAERLGLAAQSRLATRVAPGCAGRHLGAAPLSVEPRRYTVWTASAARWRLAVVRRLCPGLPVARYGSRAVQLKGHESRRSAQLVSATRQRVVSPGAW